MGESFVVPIYSRDGRASLSGAGHCLGVEDCLLLRAGLFCLAIFDTRAEALAAAGALRFSGCDLVEEEEGVDGCGMILFPSTGHEAECERLSFSGVDGEVSIDLLDMRRGDVRPARPSLSFPSRVVKDATIRAPWSGGDSMRRGRALAEIVLDSLFDETSVIAAQKHIETSPHAAIALSRVSVSEVVEEIEDIADAAEIDVVVPSDLAIRREISRHTLEVRDAGTRGVVMDVAAWAVGRCG